MELTKRTECPFCKENDFKSLFKKKYSHPDLQTFINNYYQSVLLDQKLQNETYEISQCINCEGLFQTFIPDDNFSNFLYNNLISANDSLKKKADYFIKNKNKLNEDMLLVSSLFNKKIDKIKILEFGCGWGYWSKFMQSKLFNITTCEFSEKRHNHLISNKILNFRNLDQISDKFDFIYSEEVLEHISSPLETLMQLKNLLAKDGFMLHRFPSTFLFKEKLIYNYKPKKDCGHPLEHINLINKKSFLRMCKKINLNIYNPIRNQKLKTKIKTLKNNFIFNSVILFKND